MSQLSNTTASRLIGLLERPQYQLRDCIFPIFTGFQQISMPSLPGSQPGPAPDGYIWSIEGATITGTSGTTFAGQWTLKKVGP